MEIIKFKNNDKQYEVTVSGVSLNPLRKKITFDCNLPTDSVLTQGFYILNEHSFVEQADFSSLNYIYKKDKTARTIILTQNKDDVYVEPVVVEPTPLTEEEIAEQAKQATIASLTQQIESLKEEIAATDYVFTKQYEAQLVSAELPYTDEYIAELHSERQIFRNQINDLQIQLDEINGVVVEEVDVVEETTEA